MLNRAVSQIDESERNYESALGDLSSELETALSDQDLGQPKSDIG